MFQSKVMQHSSVSFYTITSFVISELKAFASVSSAWVNHTYFPAKCDSNYINCYEKEVCCTLLL